MAVPSHLDSAAILLAQTREELAGIEREYADCVTKMRISPKLRVATLDYMVHQRAILDYLAHELLPFCKKSPNKVYFPIAKRHLHAVEFHQALNTKWLPGLADQRPDIFAYLDALQHYRLGNEWLIPFSLLANTNKHVRLTTQSISDCEAVVIRNPRGSGALQIGDRGAQAVHLQEGGSLRFEGPPGEYLTVRGPQTIDRNTTGLVDADPGLELIRQAWTENKFPEFPLQPAIVFIRIVDVEIRRIVAELSKLAGWASLDSGTDSDA
jgi:hypothetical protein